MGRIQAALMCADLFVSVGTSGAVYPAAGFVQMANACGARTCELNLAPSAGTAFFDEACLGLAGERVPYWVVAVMCWAARSASIHEKARHGCAVQPGRGK